MQKHARPRRRRAYDLEDFPPEAIAEAEAIFEELDVIHPGWLDYRPYLYEFHHRARVAWLLHRLEKQVLWREGGKPAPRLNWRLRVIGDDRDPNAAFCHPVYPGQPWHENFWMPPPLEMTAEPAGPSASELAFNLKMSLERVERLLPTCPADCDPREWLADIKARTGGAP